MEKKDTMINDFQDLFSNIRKDFRKNLDKDTSFVKLFCLIIRYALLIVLCGIIIPITHLILYILPGIFPKDDE